jgi:hypothetical protein
MKRKEKESNKKEWAREKLAEGLLQGFHVVE